MSRVSHVVYESRRMYESCRIGVMSYVSHVKYESRHI